MMATSFSSEHQPALPEGYYYADPRTTTETEVTSLVLSANQGDQLSDFDFPDAAHPERFYVVARDQYRNALVGFSLLEVFPKSPARERQSGMLSYLMVHPDHQHNGIARALILERLRIAHALGLGRLTAGVSQKNTLEPFYRENGFVNNIGEYELVLNKGRD
jgi:GNAT superfamily N-acetyltransferase